MIDLRPIGEYLERHIQGSIPLLFELGPGLGGRARDLLPLDARLILLEDGSSSLEYAAASFRGKGFDVAGYVPNAIDSLEAKKMAASKVSNIGEWDEVSGGRASILLDVKDPGTTAISPRHLSIPVERLWVRAPEIDPRVRTGVVAGWGVRAAAAIGILEHLGFQDLVYVRTRAETARPPQAGSEVFRVGGPA